MSHVRSQLNAFGLAIDTSNRAANSGVNAVIHGGEIHANRQDGVVAVGGSPIAVLLEEAVVFANGGFGVRAIGNNVTARLYHSAVAGNGTGVAGVNSEQFSPMATTVSMPTIGDKDRAASMRFFQSLSATAIVAQCKSFEALGLDKATQVNGLCCLKF